MIFKPKPLKRPRDYKYHIVLSFEDNGALYYVVKYYGIYKQWWHYEIWSSLDMKLNKERGFRIVKHRAKKEDEK